jgi:hypothetical protein
MISSSITCPLDLRGVFLKNLEVRADRLRLLTSALVLSLTHSSTVQTGESEVISYWLIRRRRRICKRHSRRSELFVFGEKKKRKKRMGNGAICFAWLLSSSYASCRHRLAWGIMALSKLDWISSKCYRYLVPYCMIVPVTEGELIESFSI